MRDDENIDMYAVLQVHPTAEPEIVDAAYRRLARMYHPDVNKAPGAHETMIRINLAYEILGDPAKCAAYDRDRANRQQTEWQAWTERAERERRERAEREQRQRQARAEQERHESERQTRAKQESSEQGERSDTEHKLPFGKAIIGGIKFGVIYCIISTVAMFVLDWIGLDGPLFIAQDIVRGMNMLLVIVSFLVAIFIPLWDERNLHPRRLIRFVRAFLATSFVLLSFLAGLIVVTLFIDAEAQTNIFLAVSSLIVATVCGIVCGLFRVGFDALDI